jgi:hypothetical protein
MSVLPYIHPNTHYAALFNIYNKQSNLSLSLEIPAYRGALIRCVLLVYSLLVLDLSKFIESLEAPATEGEAPCTLSIRKLSSLVLLTLISFVLNVTFNNVSRPVNFNSTLARLIFSIRRLKQNLLSRFPKDGFGFVNLYCFAATNARCTALQLSYKMHFLYSFAKIQAGKTYFPTLQQRKRSVRGIENRKNIFFIRN